MKLEKASRCRLGNRVVQKREVITVRKAWEKIVDRRANEVIIIQSILVRAKRAAYNTMV